MSQVIVIEPYRMLQQAFVVGLFPEYQVRALKKIPDTALAADVMIIDAVALRARGLLTPREIELVRSWKVPTIWIDTELVANGVALPDVVHVLAPVTRDILRSAVAECLQDPNRARTVATAKTPPDAPPRSKSKPEQPVPRSIESGRDFIELVDVFEEPERHDGSAERGTKD